LTSFLVQEAKQKAVQQAEAATRKVKLVARKAVGGDAQKALAKVSLGKLLNKKPCVQITSQDGQRCVVGDIL
jgi:hypothetical protein